MRTRVFLAAIVALVALIVPGPALAHGLVGRLDSPLPLVVYVGGAAIVVALSFLVVFKVGTKWRATPPGPVRQLPRWLTTTLRAIGLVGWLWIMAQLVFGGTSDAEISTIFTWVYGWVGIAIVSALIGPVWPWLDPFSTIHDIGAWCLRRFGIRGIAPVAYPERLAQWPAVIGFAFFVWLELAFRGGSMGLIVLGYTVVTLMGMAQYGRDAWREQGEVFSVWFGLLGRLAPYSMVGRPERGRVQRRYFPDGLVASRWDTSAVLLAALGAASIVYDGLSQTEAFFDLFGFPSLPDASALLAGFGLLVVGLALGVMRVSGQAALGAGLVPIAAGYLVAHYLTYLAGEGPRVIVAISDPLQQGWDLFGTAFYEFGTDWLSPGLVWLVMMVAVIGGHITGAWAGHFAAVRAVRGRRDVRRAQIPLVLVMIGLTTTSLWSLGQTAVREDVERRTPPVPIVSPRPEAAP